MLSQIEGTLEGLKERSGGALEVVQQGVETVGTKLGLIEPKPRRNRGVWLVVGALGAVLVVSIVAFRRRSMSYPKSEAERHETAVRPKATAAS
jgi:hypothetical protein